MQSLWKEARRPLAPASLLLAASATLGVGLALPVVTLRAGFASDSYSVLTGIVDLARSGEVLLALIVFGFSVAFPLVKLVLLAGVYLRPLEEGRRSALVRRLEYLGRWSMLDVFVVAILIGSVHLGILSEARAEPGIYVFGAGILLSMLATLAVQRLLGTAGGPGEVARATRAQRWLSLAALALLVLGLFLPLMVVEKWHFWDHEYSVLAASARMLAEGEGLLGGAVLLFVVLLPLARLLGLALLRWLPRPGRLVRPVLVLEKWAMLDVFALALLVVVAKIGTLAAVETRAGFWLLLAATALSFLDARALRRGARPGAEDIRLPAAPEATRAS